MTNPKKSPLAEIPRLEWVVGALGFFFVMATVGILLHEEMNGDKTPPTVKLAVENIASLETGYLVKIRANNAGGEPAARVAITAELTSPGEMAEVVETQFDYLPAHSTRRAGIFFKRDPKQGELRLQANSYEEP